MILSLNDYFQNGTKLPLGVVCIQLIRIVLNWIAEPSFGLPNNLGTVLPMKTEIAPEYSNQQRYNVSIPHINVDHDCIHGWSIV